MYIPITPSLQCASAYYRVVRCGFEVHKGDDGVRGLSVYNI